MNVLIPLDGSSLAEEVLPSLQALSSQERPILLRVVPPVAGSSTCPDAPDWSDRNTARELDELITEARAYLARIAASQPRPVETRVLVGHPGEAIVDAVSRWDIERVLMTCRWRSESWGRTADWVWHRCPCSVVLLRTGESISPAEDSASSQLSARIDELQRQVHRQQEQIGHLQSLVVKSL
ncbi:universal stress protein [bacterium CPR1]|nr:universal stress protein [bacterium CPR1]